MRLFLSALTLLVAASGAAVPAYAADGSLDAVFARIDKAAATFKGLRADVKKVSHLDLINEDTVDTGTIVVKRPKPHDLKMLVNIQQPDAKQLALADNKVEFYYPKPNEVQEFDLSKENKSLAEQGLLLGFGSNSKDLQSAYNIKLGGAETITEKKTTRIELIPKSKEFAARVPKIELWISDESGLALQQKIYQGGGDYLLATYTNMRIDPNIPDNDVKLNLPKNAHRVRPQK